MIRLCILGNSHVAALKQASAGFCAEHAQARLTFFAAVSRDSRAMRVTGDSYAPTTDALAAQFRLTSGGAEAIAATAHDAFLLYGFGGRGAPEDRPANYSHALRTATVLARLRADLLIQHMTALRALTGKPVFAALKPLPAVRPDRTPRRLLPQSEVVALAQARLADPLAVEMIPQPATTLIDDLATDPVHSAGSTPLERPARARRDAHPEDEQQHMNAGYGRLWLEAFWPVLRARLRK